MKKTLIALAAVAVSSAAMAQVTVFGLIDTAYINDKYTFEDDATAKITVKNAGVAGGRTAGNRLGFRGTEDLGGGLKANFLHEAAIATLSPDDTGTAAVGNIRQSFVGLEGGFGSITAGYQYTADFRVSGGYLAGTENTVGNAHDGLGQTITAAGGTVTVTDPNGRVTRATVVQYISPSFGGVKVLGQWSGTNAKASQNGSQDVTTDHMAYGADYDQGPLSVKLAYQTNENKTVADNKTKQKSTVAGASYDLGMAKLIAQYGQRKLEQPGQENIKTTHYNVGVQVPMGKLTLAASMGQADFKVSGGGNDIDQDTFQLMASYGMSKRTTLYANYGSEKFNVDAANGEAKVNAFTAGLRHSF